MTVKKIILAILSLTIAGCSANINPFSPPVKTEVQNSGSIDDIKTNTNGIMAEVGNIKNKLEIQGSTLRDLQDGLINLKLGGNENSGTQILSGDGGLMLVFSISMVGMLLGYFFYKEKKTNKILADAIKTRNDSILHENIIKAAAYTNVEKKIYNLLYKQ